MALIKCPECGHEISDLSAACIHCGYPIPTKLKQEDVASGEKEPVSVEKQPVQRPMGTRQKIAICVGILAAALIILLIWSARSRYGREQRQHRDLSAAFDFSFDMNMEDIIAYEAEKYGHTEYHYDPDVNRLDFEECDSDHWKHKYFFDDSGILKSVDYMDAIVSFGKEDEIKCVHVKPIERAVLKLIGKWDSSSQSGLFHYATGRIDGIDVHIQYMSGSIEGISVSRQNTD